VIPRNDSKHPKKLKEKRKEKNTTEHNINQTKQQTTSGQASK
jgi:hypothetical protein